MSKPIILVMVFMFIYVFHDSAAANDVLPEYKIDASKKTLCNGKNLYEINEYTKKIDLMLNDIKRELASARLASNNLTVSFYENRLDKFKFTDNPIILGDKNNSLTIEKVILPGNAQNSTRNSNNLTSGLDYSKSRKSNDIMITILENQSATMKMLVDIDHRLSSIEAVTGKVQAKCDAR